MELDRAKDDNTHIEASSNEAVCGDHGILLVNVGWCVVGLLPFRHINRNVFYEGDRVNTSENTEENLG